MKNKTTMPGPIVILLIIIGIILLVVLKFSIEGIFALSACLMVSLWIVLAKLVKLQKSLQNRKK